MKLIYFLFNMDYLEVFSILLCFLINNVHGTLKPVRNCRATEQGFIYVWRQYKYISVAFECDL